MNALPYLLEKEFKQFLRNALLPRIALMVPLMVMLVAPLVATMDVRDVRVALVDHDRTVASRRLADRVAASPYYLRSWRAPPPTPPRSASSRTTAPTLS